jgi:hypothetical protein
LVAGAAAGKAHRHEMLIVIGVWVAIAGAVAALAGLSGMHRVRRLRGGGVATWAVPVPEPLSGPDEPVSGPDEPVSGPEETVSRPEETVSAPGPPAGSPPRVLLQYRLTDGRVLERSARARAANKAPLRPGEPVLIWYDPADPDDILIYGRWGRAADRAFLAAGTLLVLTGVALAVAPT